MNFPRTALLATLTAASVAAGTPLFERVSTFNICEQLDDFCNVDEATNAETLWHFGSSFLVYTDSEAENLGFVNIANPYEPEAFGTVPLGGEPTTVRVVGDFAVVGVNTSPNYVNATGKLAVVHLEDQTIIHEIELPGQPDAVDVSKDTTTFPIYIAVAIENERDEDLGDGAPPQMPPGYLTIMTIDSEAALADPTLWMSESYDLTGYADACRFPEDPEPEYVAIHPDNTRVVVTLQENNCNMIVELETGNVLAAYDAGSVVLDKIDTKEEGLILQVDSTVDVSRETGGALLREPDGAAWIGETDYFATANEGDLDGGSRGWSIVDANSGEVVYDSGNTMEWETAKIGHYPDERSGNKGNEPENVFYEKFPEFGTEYVFVLSERSSVVFVYSIDSSVSPPSPELLQILPVGTGPEGITAIPSKNLIAIASEVDERENKIRSSIALFELKPSTTGVPEYPTLISVARDGSGEEGPPIPFGALSGLAAASPYGSETGTSSTLLYTIDDSFYNSNRILTIDVSTFPAVIIAEQAILDTDAVLSDCLGSVPSVDVSSVVNDDTTVNIDPEGISVNPSGGYWVVSEGKAGNEGLPNLLLEIDISGTITKCVLPDDSFQTPLKFGFEGVAVDGSKIAVAVQRAWGEEAYPRIAVYDTDTETWKYAFYPLNDPDDVKGGWVGLSDIAPLGGGKFLVLERDNQGGPDAYQKSIYLIDLGYYSWTDGTILTKTLYDSLLDDLTSTNGQILEKIEGIAVTSDGHVWINSDNDGVDDSSGESVLLEVNMYPAVIEEPDVSGALSLWREQSIVLVTLVSCLAPIVALVTGF